jgi:hypothetical protein
VSVAFPPTKAQRPDSKSKAQSSCKFPELLVTPWEQYYHFHRQIDTQFLRIYTPHFRKPNRQRYPEFRYYSREKAPLK